MTDLLISSSFRRGAPCSATACRIASLCCAISSRGLGASSSVGSSTRQIRRRVSTGPLRSQSNDAVESHAKPAQPSACRASNAAASTGPSSGFHGSSSRLSRGQAPAANAPMKAPREGFTLAIAQPACMQRSVTGGRRAVAVAGSPKMRVKLGKTGSVSYFVDFGTLTCRESRPRPAPASRASTSSGISRGPFTESPTNAF